MQDVLMDARRALRRAPAPASPLPEMLESMARGRPPGGADAARLLNELGKRPDLFRLVDPWRGPWRPLLYPASRTARPVDERLLAFGIGSGPWVVGPVEAGDPDQHLALRRLRESLAHLGRVADTDSFVSATRIARLLWSGGRTALRLRRGSV